MNTDQLHPVSWWAQFQEASATFDAASVTETLGHAINRQITAPLLHREAQITLDVVVRHLNKKASRELAERAAQAVTRFTTTVRRVRERGTADEGVGALEALCDVLEGRFAEAAAHAEPHMGTYALCKAFVSALSLVQIDDTLTLRLLRDGHEPALAVRVGLMMGKYAWWPQWLLRVVHDRALAGTLDEETISALDQCAYADLSPAQARMARRLLSDDEGLRETSAQRLERMGEEAAAAKLREGDIAAVALASRLL